MRRAERRGCPEHHLSVGGPYLEYRIGKGDEPAASGPDPGAPTFTAYPVCIADTVRNETWE